jgi:hypothetical protein
MKIGGGRLSVVVKHSGRCFSCDDTHWASQEKNKKQKSGAQFLHHVKPGDENFTKIGDSLAPASSLGDPLFWVIADGDVI